MEPIETVTGFITSLAFGGKGILKDKGFVYFVPFVAVGDLVKIKVIEKKKSHGFGEVLEYISKSQERVVPLCPYFGTCGGCQLQHLPYTAQLKHKEEVINEALSRQAKITPNDPLTVVPADPIWAYRRHIRLKLLPLQKGFTAGFVPYTGSGLLTIQKCPIFTNISDSILSLILQIIGKLNNHSSKEGSLTIVKASSFKYVLAFSFKDSIPSNCNIIFDSALQESNCIQGIVIESKGKEMVFGQTLCSFTFDNLHIDFSPQAFVQNHPEQSANIYRQVCDISKKTEAKNILDLYCGIGISSILLARQGAKVIGVEGNPKAIERAKKNAQKNGVVGVEFIYGDVARTTKQLIHKQKPNLILVNPPRTGIDPKTLDALKNSLVQNIIYISCMPSTLARDVKELQQSGYSLTQSFGYDMFPQTAHVETLLHLVRRKTNRLQ